MVNQCETTAHNTGRRRSVSMDIGANDRMSMDTNDRLGDLLLWVDLSHHFSGSGPIIIGSRQHTSYSSPSLLNIIAFCSFIHIWYPFGFFAMQTCAGLDRRVRHKVVDLHVSLHSWLTRSLAFSTHSLLSSQVRSMYTYFREGFKTIASE